MSENETITPEVRRAPRWLKIALGVSIALNVLIVAAVAGLAIRHGHGGGGAGFRDIRSFAQFVPEERRDEARAVLETRHEAFREARREMRQARRAAGEAFSAEPYDPVAVEQALADLRAASGAMRSLAHGAMVEIGGELTAEERAEVIAKFRERGRRWREQRRLPGEKGRIVPHDRPSDGG